MIFWAQYLKLTRMEDCYEFYQEDSYDIPTFLSINSIMKIWNRYCTCTIEDYSETNFLSM
jgi:hypothetical protein